MAKASILIVEDDSAVAMEIRDRLRYLGCGISGLVSCAEEAIEKAAESRPDLVLIDIRLEGDSDL
jgi:DNA-binding NarL/FixJ family response regulator